MPNKIYKHDKLKKVKVRMSKNEKQNKKIYFDFQSSFFFFVGLK